MGTGGLSPSVHHRSRSRRPSAAEPGERAPPCPPHLAPSLIPVTGGDRDRAPPPHTPGSPRIWPSPPQTHGRLAELHLTIGAQSRGPTGDGIWRSLWGPGALPCPPSPTPPHAGTGDAPGGGGAAPGGAAEPVSTALDRSSFSPIINEKRPGRGGAGANKGTGWGAQPMSPPPVLVAVPAGGHSPALPGEGVPPIPVQEPQGWGFGVPEVVGMAVGLQGAPSAPPVTPPPWSQSGKGDGGRWGWGYWGGGSRDGEPGMGGDGMEEEEGWGEEGGNEGGGMDGRNGMWGLGGGWGYGIGDGGSGMGRTRMGETGIKGNQNGKTGMGGNKMGKP